MKKMLLLALMIAGTSVSPVYADDDNTALEKQCKISRKEAQEIALKQVAGTVTDTDVEKSADGKAYWSIDVKPATGTEQEVHVCAETGKVISVEADKD